jgi:lipoprotein signal peptidase
MNIYEKFGDFVLNFVLLTIGGVAYAAIENAHYDASTVYILCTCTVIICLVIAWMLFYLDKKQKLSNHKE